MRGSSSVACVRGRPSGVSRAPGRGLPGEAGGLGGRGPRKPGGVGRRVASQGWLAGRGLKPRWVWRGFPSLGWVFGRPGASCAFSQFPHLAALPCFVMERVKKWKNERIRTLKSKAKANRGEVSAEIFMAQETGMIGVWVVCWASVVGVWPSWGILVSRFWAVFVFDVESGQ